MKQTPQLRSQPGSGPFILTLCELAKPVVIRPPQSPQLKPFTFFMSRSRQPNGSESLRLHMGYFGSLAEAEQWGEALRRSYPHAAASLAPAHLRQRDPGVPTLSAAEPAATPVHAPAPNLALSDTQMLRVLETRQAAPQESGVVEEVAGISVVRPEDTNTRRILKEAVAQGAPVSFAVQLEQSAQTIDLAAVPALSIFRAYKLYVIEGHREGRSWESLRLGFFDDAISAKQVAHYVRSNFPSVAVVPVTADEHKFGDAHALTLPGLRATPMPTAATKPSVVAPPAKATPAKPKPRAAGSLEETLEMLAASEMWNDADSLSETGVRHLKIDVQKARRSR
jgi:hypothetical protein